MSLLVGAICYSVMATLALVVSRVQIRRLCALKRRYYDTKPVAGIPTHLVSYGMVSKFVRETETEKHREIHAAELERDRQANLAQQHRQDYFASEARADALARKVSALELERKMALRDQQLDERRRSQHAREQKQRKEDQARQGLFDSAEEIFDSADGD